MMRKASFFSSYNSYHEKVENDLLILLQFFGLLTVNTPRATPPSGGIEKPTDLATKNYESTKPTGEAAFTDKNAVVTKPLPHSPIISPSSIPNPNPSVTVTKHLETSYPNYNNYLFSIPGYSAFQPVNYQGLPTPTILVKPSETTNQSTSTDFTHFPIKKPKISDSSNTTMIPGTHKEKNADEIVNTDFEDKFTTEIVTSITTTEGVESKLNITSLRQGSGATVTIPSQTESKKKTEKFSLKTSIPISKLDMKSVSPNDNSNNSLSKIDIKCVKANNSSYSHVPMKPIPFKPTFHSLKAESRVEIQSNIVIKSANNEIEEKNDLIKSNNINTLISAAEVVNKNEPAFWNTESANDIQNDAKNLSNTKSSAKQLFNPINHDTKLNVVKKPPDVAKSETKNQLLIIQNKTNSNQKMLLTLTQQQNNSQPQALPQTTTDSKNLQAPSRLSNVNENCKEELIKENGSSNVVSLKRLHHENCDENDFENLITENQIYGNKIVVKERSQGTLQEQDIKPKTKQADVKNVVLQPNFLYVSNVQFPTNLMMIKNTNTINQNMTEQLKNNNNKIDIKTNNGNLINTNDTKPMYTKTTNNIVVSKDIQIVKSNNSVLQTLAGKQNTQDIIFQTNQVIMNPQIIYQVPMLVENDSHVYGSTFVNQSYSKFVTQKKETVKEQPTKQNEKLYIACPYQMDSKLQPKIVITNLKPKLPKEDEISTLDNYEKRKRMRRGNHITNRNNIMKIDPKKFEKQVDFINIITADNMKDEMCKEFAKTKIVSQDKITDSESDYERDELQDYANVIKEYSPKNQVKPASNNKKLFLSILKLGTQDYLKEKDLEKFERIIQRDAVAKAYIAAGRLDKLSTTERIRKIKDKPKSAPKPKQPQEEEIEKDDSAIHLYRKKMFLAKFGLGKAKRRYKEDYEKAWQEILKERQRRNGTTIEEDINKAKTTPDAINPNDQLKLLTDIKNSVTENNNLIKRRLDEEKDVTQKVKSSDADNICAMAEKSVSKLITLSKMADRSVQILSGKDAKKRDLNPSFDSERMSGNDTKKRDLNPAFDSDRTQNTIPATEPPKPSQFPIKIPNISKIINLTTEPDTEQDKKEEQNNIAATPPPSVEEPSDSTPYTLKYKAYNHIEILANDKYLGKDGKEVKVMVWPGIDTIKTSYKVLDAAREKEIQDLQRRNKELQVSWAKANRKAAKETELYLTLQTMHQKLAKEEEYWRLAVVRLVTIINTVRNYQ